MHFDFYMQMKLPVDIHSNLVCVCGNDCKPRAKVHNMRVQMLRDGMQSKDNVSRPSHDNYVVIPKCINTPQTVIWQLSH
jgi:hypothetical protein